jgi:DNA-binding transcriptional ArsR family regulator
MARRRPPRLSVKEAAQLFALLGEPARLRILLLIRDKGEAIGTDLAAASGLSRPTVSYHLRQLWHAGVVEARRAGKQVFYRVSSPLVAEVLKAVGGE